MIVETSIFIGIVVAASFIGATVSNWAFNGTTKAATEVQKVQTEVNVMRSEYSKISIAEIALLVVIIVLISVLITGAVMLYKKSFCKKPTEIDAESLRNVQRN